MTSAVPVTAEHVYTEALRGHRCLVWEADLPPWPLPVTGWRSDADAADQVLLGHCRAPVLDIGCGPGRMTQALTRQGVAALGIDVVAEAVSQARARGAAALRRDVFDPVPGHGQWLTALLADGNIGIGGDPVSLLVRIGELLAPEGRVVVDLSPPGSGLRVSRIRLTVHDVVSHHVPWGVVGVDAVEHVARAAGFTVRRVDRHGRRWYAVLGRTS